MEAKRRRKLLLAEERERVRNEFGYTRLAKSGLKSKRPDFPDLSVPSRLPPTSDSIGNGFAPKPLPEDAIRFPIGTSHKQGPMLITKFDRLEDMGGRKT